MGSAAFWIALASVALAAVLLGAAALTLARLLRAPAERTPRVVSRTPAREPPADPSLREEVDRAQEEARRARQLATLAATLDLDELLQQILRTAVAVSGADAAALVFPAESGHPIEKTLNLAPEEAAPSLEGLWSENRARAVAVRYRYSGQDGTAAREPIRSALVVPLTGGQEEPLGTLAAYWRQDSHEPGDEALAALEELAASSARAIANARRFREVHQLAVRDALTGLYNRHFFDETLAREVKRAHRYDRDLALVVFDLDGFKAINDRIGHLGGDAVLAEMAGRLRSVVRSADFPCRIGGDEFAVILPEAALIDAEQLFQRFQLALEASGAPRSDRLRLSAGIAELRRDDDAISLYRRADQALLSAKRAGKGRVVAADDFIG